MAAAWFLLVIADSEQDMTMMIVSAFYEFMFEKTCDLFYSLQCAEGEPVQPLLSIQKTLEHIPQEKGPESYLTG